MLLEDSESVVDLGYWESVGKGESCLTLGGSNIPETNLGEIKFLDGSDFDCT